MNILVRTYSGHVIVRPDTTWERDNEDLYIPDFVNAVSASPVLFARVSKPGRSVLVKFASRYFDAVGGGVLLYPDDLNDGSPEGYACASCLDHTSFLPWPFIGIDDFKTASFELFCGGKQFYSLRDFSLSEIEKTVELVTKYCYIRTGDLIAIELAPSSLVAQRTDSEIRFNGSFSGQENIDFKIIF